VISTTVVGLPRVHMAGSSTLHDAHIEVGAHGIAVFLAPEAPFPILDIDATREQLREVVGRLAAALHDPDTAADTMRRGAWDLSS
jgi:hypothetical protein